jgi:hypothetical protein
LGKAMNQFGALVIESADALRFDGLLVEFGHVELLR